MTKSAEIFQCDGIRLGISNVIIQLVENLKKYLTYYIITLGITNRISSTLRSFFEMWGGIWAESCREENQHAGKR